MTPVGTVIWQGMSRALQVTSRAELVWAIEQALKEAQSRGMPLSLELCVHNTGVMSIVVGAERSYLVFKPQNGRFCHVADDVKQGTCMVFLEDGHLSEIDLKFTVPFELAREALLSFAETGEIPKTLSWMSA